MGLGKQYDLKNATVTLTDAAGTPNTLAVKIAEGTLNINITTNREFNLDRGKVATGTVRNADETPMSFDMNTILQAMKSSSGDDPTVSEFLTQTGNASAYVTTGDACDPYCVDIVIVLDNSGCTGSIEDETLTLPKCYVTSENISVGPGTLAINGECKATRPTITRS